MNTSAIDTFRNIQATAKLFSNVSFDLVKRFARFSRRYHRQKSSVPHETAEPSRETEARSGSPAVDLLAVVEIRAAPPAFGVRERELHTGVRSDGDVNSKEARPPRADNLSTRDRRTSRYVSPLRKIEETARRDVLASSYVVEYRCKNRESARAFHGDVKLFVSAAVTPPPVYRRR